MIMAINNNKLLTMKKIVINTGLILGLFAALSLNACKEEIDPIVEQLEFARAFTPTGLTAQISNITKVTLDWIAAKDIDHYVVEIYPVSYTHLRAHETDSYLV